MTPIEIALIIIGCIIIIISFRVIGKSDKDDTSASHNKSVELSDIEQIEIKKKIDELVNEVCEEAINKTDDYLSKISNEKILAVNEFSDQIIEKINANHQEVVFLYHMLNDKEEELKKAVAEINTAKRKIQEIIEIAKKGGKDKNPKQISDQKISDKQVVVKEPETQKKGKQNRKTLEKETEKKINTQLAEEHITENEISVSEDKNHNEEILELYRNGVSIVDIAKSLDLGQGEVKLVIDLYQK